MHLLLTDRLVCPRCGPPFGLILLSDRMHERRVVDGTLGCANCRETYAIRSGFADLRAPPRAAPGPGLVGREGAAADLEAEAERLQALLGILGGPGTVALVGAPAAVGPHLAPRLGEIHLVGVDEGLRAWSDACGWSRLAAGPTLPFFSGVLRGAVVDARLGEEAVAEAARVTVPRGRVVVVSSDAASPDPAVAEAAGLEVLAAEGGTLVAQRGPMP